MSEADEDQEFARCFAEGRRAGRIGLSPIANPYMQADAICLAAWVEGHASVDMISLSGADRAAIFDEGSIAGQTGEPATSCPYLDDEEPERMEIWLLGYAPNV